MVVIVAPVALQSLLTGWFGWGRWMVTFCLSWTIVWLTLEGVPVLVLVWGKILVLVTVLTAPEEINFCSSAADIIFVCDAGWACEDCTIMDWDCCLSWVCGEFTVISAASGCLTITRWTWLGLCWLLPTGVTMLEDAMCCGGPETTQQLFKQSI